VILTDIPLRAIQFGDHYQTFQGYVLEEICRSCITQTAIFGSTIKIFDPDWVESCTEIDVVAYDESTRIVYWGSCKRNPAEQDPFNSVCHVISYFNNRHYSKDPWYAFSHRLVFVSPQMTSQHRTEIVERKDILNNWLRETEKSKIVESCHKMLSAFKTGKKFEAAADMPNKLSIQIDEIICLDFQNLWKKLQQ